MSASSLPAPNPPSERDLRLYEQIQVECRGVREVAAEHGLAPAEVRQIVAQVREWRSRHPEPMPSPREMLRLHVARLERMWQETTDAFEASKRDEVTTTITRDEHGERHSVRVKSRPPTGDKRFLRLADQILRDLRKAQAELEELERKEQAREAFADYSSTILARLEEANLRPEAEDPSALN
jgi:hypothetical protein